MFPKKERIAKKRDIDNVHKKGKKVHGRYTMLIFLETKRPIRATVVVSNKVCAKATKRNALKRQLREIMKTYTKHKMGDFMLYAKKRAASANTRLLSDDVRSLFEKVEQLKQKPQ